MVEPNVGIGSPVEDFISDLTAQVRSGLKKNGFMSCPERDAHMRFEMIATQERQVNGGFKIYILNADGKSSGSESQRVTVYAREINEAEESARGAELKAQVEEAKAREELARNPPVEMYRG